MSFTTPILRRYNQCSSPLQFAHHKPGEIVTAVVRNPLQDPKTTGKARPVILLRRDGAWWLAMGLSTLDHFADGSLRRRVPNPLPCGRPRR